MFLENYNIGFQLTGLDPDVALLRAFSFF